MRTADDAWQEWGGQKGFRDYDLRKAAFMAGYRRALQDAAADLAAAANPDQVWQIADTIRDRAAGVGTKEEAAQISQTLGMPVSIAKRILGTKDGDDDE